MVQNLVTIQQISVRKNKWGVASGTNLLIDLPTYNVEFTDANKLLTVPFPVTTKNANTKTATRIAIPLKLIEERIVVNGWLVDSPSGDSDYKVNGVNTGGDAVTKMKALKAMEEGGGNTVFVWRGMTFSTGSICPVQIMNVKITDEYETINAADANKIDSDIPDSGIGKLRFTMELLLARERGT